MKLTGHDARFQFTLRTGLFTALVALLATAASMAFGVVPAGAAATHPFLETFGSAAQPSFVGAEGVAVDGSTGDLLVIDAGEGTVSRYSPDGASADFSALGTNVIDANEGPGGKPCAEEPASCDLNPEHPGLSFGSPGEVQVAVDNSGGVTDGDIYVPQAGAKVVDVFASTGEFIGQLSGSEEGAFAEPCGVTVDPSGNVYVGDFSGHIHKYEPAANPPVNTDNHANFAFGSNCTLAAGAGPTAGFIFAAHFLGSVSKLDSATGEEKYAVDPGPATTVGVDPVSGHLYAAQGSEIVEFDSSGASGAVEVSGTALAGGAQGVAVAGSTGNLFATGAGGANVEVFGPLPPPVPPVVTVLSPSKGPTGGGDLLEITGTNLAEATKVQFGATVVNAASFVEDTATSIKLNVPAHAAGTFDVIVTTASGASTVTAADDYTFIADPHVIAVSPSKGPTGGGNQVEIEGANLAEATSVEFGASVIAASSLIEDTATSIKLDAPAHAPGTVNVRVITLGGISAKFPADDYTYEVPIAAVPGVIEPGVGAGAATLTASPPLTATVSLRRSPSSVVRVGAGRQQGESVLLRVTVTGAGKLTATGRNLRRTSIALTRTAMVTLRLRLTAAAKKQLKKKGRLRVRVGILFTPTSGTPGAATATVVFNAKLERKKVAR